ncbi:hypothetical protein FDJ57_gp15 [Gordonia phage Sour]|uniref:Major capsid pentamer protein n=1 Tax=Gordonia phage Sour TaxID=2182349 RepID=A0A2U8ULA5_9CAUD|nr:hypothetical protein FDJ57_gp15 [Gordonia phage Sour]AWN04216.1 major capsid pentamer protein [Gordonia phage Sour]
MTVNDLIPFTIGERMTTPILDPVRFEAPLVNPSPTGLYAVTTWNDTAVPRWLAGGVEVRPNNYGGESAFGIWAADWCGEPGEDDLKYGTRPVPDDPFDALTVWAYDQCDLTAPSQAEVRVRVQQNLRLIEQVAVEREIATRLIADAPAGPPADDIVGAVGHLEAQLAKTNTLGLIHASAAVAADAQRHNLIVRTGGSLRTPLGHTWVFGGGYVDGLGKAMIATSPTYGWRDEAVVRDTVEARTNTFAAVAERSVVIGYEKAIATAWLT